MTHRGIELHIDTLVLRGVHGVDTTALAEAFQQALEEQLTAQALVPESDRTLAQVRVPALRLPLERISGGVDGRTFGQALARSIHSALAGSVEGHVSSTAASEASDASGASGAAAGSGAVPRR
jgi:hypothetical protein